MEKQGTKTINYLMEDNNDLSRLFLLYMNDNYNLIKKSFLKAKELNKELSEDIYQEGILKCAERINKVGLRIDKPELSGQTFKNYLFISLKNIIHKERDKNKRMPKDENYIHERDFEHLDVYDFEYSLEREHNRIEEDVLIQDIFNWIEGKYKPIYVGFFKFYFKTEYSYREIAKLTGYGVATIFLQIGIRLFI
jgi:RNA polymerase sigma factor (sigma-70 family)